MIKFLHVVLQELSTVRVVKMVEASECLHASVKELLYVFNIRTVYNYLLIIFQALK